MEVDARAWREAGGDPMRLERAASVALAAAFATDAGRALAMVHPLAPEVGVIGDWVGDDAPRVEAEAWLVERGCATARAPVLLTDWGAEGASLGPFEEAPYAGEPTGPASPWEQAGYRVSARRLAAAVPLDALLASGFSTAERLTGQGWRLTPLGEAPSIRADEPASLRFAEDFIRIARTSESADERLVIHPLHLAAQLTAPPAPIDPRLCFRLDDPTGAPAGILAAGPDLAVPERRWLVVQRVAVRGDLRRRGLGAWLLGATHRAGQRLGYRAAIHQALDTDRFRSAVHAARGRVIRVHALLERALESRP
jgi:GNAT superfamily N-acetyltransferase